MLALAKKLRLQSRREGAAESIRPHPLERPMTLLPDRDEITVRSFRPVVEAIEKLAELLDMFYSDALLSAKTAVVWHFGPRPCW